MLVGTVGMFRNSRACSLEGALVDQRPDLRRPGECVETLLERLALPPDLPQLAPHDLCVNVLLETEELDESPLALPEGGDL
jgi:hypothetical protein